MVTRDNRDQDREFNVGMLRGTQVWRPRRKEGTSTRSRDEGVPVLVSASSRRTGTRRSLIEYQCLGPRDSSDVGWDSVSHLSVEFRVHGFTKYSESDSKTEVSIRLVDVDLGPWRRLQSSGTVWQHLGILRGNVSFYSYPPGFFWELWLLELLDVMVTVTVIKDVESSDSVSVNSDRNWRRFLRRTSDMVT